jgi:hypothetical protein
VTLRLAGRGAGDGIVGWSLRDVPAADLDGLPASLSSDPPPEPVTHPNGALRIDHVVVFTPKLDRTAAALNAAGIELRRTREAEVEGKPFRQGFFRLGEVILEVVEHAGVPEGPATFWGVTFVVEDIDACARPLGDSLGEIKDAVQPGRRIVTFRREADLGLPVAMITPEPAG